MNEHTHADEKVVSLILRDDAIGHAVGDGLGHGMLRWAKHLQGLFGALNCYLIEQNSRRLTEQIRGHHGEQ
jgi:hypothetical protein